MNESEDRNVAESIVGHLKNPPASGMAPAFRPEAERAEKILKK